MANELIKTNDPIKNIEDALSCNVTSVNGTAQTAGDWTTLLTNQADGTKIYLGGAWRTISMIKFTVGAGATGDIVAGVADQKIYVVGFQFSCDTDATTFKWVEETTGDLTNAQTFMKGGGEVVFPYKMLLFQTAVVLKKLQGTTTVGAVTGTVWYCRF